MRFFVGLHHPHVAGRFATAFISVNALRRRKGAFPAQDWIMDSGAFSTIAKHGGYPEPVSEYAAEIRRWAANGNLLAAVAQDYMCEAWMLAKTGLTVADHQRLTIERYDELAANDTAGVCVMPVLQGFEPAEYVAHLRAYGTRLAPGAWVGVGSVCKRNGNAATIEAVLRAIKNERPDLRLHGFGLKTTALASEAVRELLDTADSMAWSYAARRQGRDANDWTEARRFADLIETMPIQRRLFAQRASWRPAEAALA
ncbi:MAG: hypothetical protein JWM87_779 [Candidatus Eremiobacteraeota bacterium]|nr:hypothetical protein [Candidatus Eremiobacteraeota bacterium]